MYKHDSQDTCLLSPCLPLRLCLICPAISQSPIVFVQLSSAHFSYRPALAFSLSLFLSLPSCPFFLSFSFLFSVLCTYVFFPSLFPSSLLLLSTLSSNFIYSFFFIPSLSHHVQFFFFFSPAHFLQSYSRSCLSRCPFPLVSVPGTSPLYTSTFLLFLLHQIHPFSPGSVLYSVTVLLLPVIIFYFVLPILLFLSTFNPVGHPLPLLHGMPLPLTCLPFRSIPFPFHPFVLYSFALLLCMFPSLTPSLYVFRLAFSSTILLFPFLPLPAFLSSSYNSFSLYFPSFLYMSCLPFLSILLLFFLFLLPSLSFLSVAFTSLSLPLFVFP